jgi:hypothetical protein
MKKLTFNIFCILQIITTNLLFSQSQVVNGIEISTPDGFKKVSDLTWKKGEGEIIQVSATKLNYKFYDYMFWDNCKDTDNRQVIRGDDLTVNEVVHHVCYFLTENAALIAQVYVIIDSHYYNINIGVDFTLFDESEWKTKPFERADSYAKYMIRRIKYN